MPILQSALLFTAIAAVSASPVLFSSPYGGGLQTRQDGAASSPAYSVPQDNDNAIRAADVSTKRETFLLGPSLGVGPTYPAGSLGKVYTDADEVIATVESDAQQDITTGDRARAKANIAKYNGLKTLDDYTKLYDNEWQNSSRPTGQDPGILTNYTQDLLFSMERLSVNPHAVRRLTPVEDLPFLGRG